jgi:hypothetical protein
MSLIAKLSAPSDRPRPTRKKPGFNVFRAVADVAGILGDYQDVPVRFQKQWISSFLAIVVLLSLVAGLYLNVTARTAITGREIQTLEAEIVANERVNADLKTDLATLLSNNTLEARALAAGYVPFEQADLEYLTVPGYFPAQGVTLVKSAPEVDPLALSPQYSESLFGWLARQIESASVPLAQVP